jgi:hypothetical protein
MIIFCIDFACFLRSTFQSKETNSLTLIYIFYVINIIYQMTDYHIIIELIKKILKSLRILCKNCPKVQKVFDTLYKILEEFYYNYEIICKGILLKIYDENYINPYRKSIILYD